MEPDTPLLNRVHCFAASRPWRGGSGDPSTGLIILVPGELHFDLLLLKFTFQMPPLGPHVGRAGELVSDPIQVPWAVVFTLVPVQSLNYPEFAPSLLHFDLMGLGGLAFCSKTFHSFCLTNVSASRTILKAQVGPASGSISDSCLPGSHRFWR